MFSSDKNFWETPQRLFDELDAEFHCKKTVFRLHRLVAEHFIGDPLPKETDVNHKDGNKQNNSASNLEWCTRSENMKHAIRTGLFYPRIGPRKVG